MRRPPASRSTAVSRGVPNERRRHPRSELYAPVVMRTSVGVIEGYTENLGYAGALVQSLTGMPVLGEPCEIDLDLPLGCVRTRGRVVRIDPAERRFAVEFEHVDSNGELLLAALITTA
jgi:hypothetical protein